MKPAAFDMVRPKTLDAALEALSGNDDARLIAGGQSLVPSMNFRLAAPALLVDLNSVNGLAGVTRDADWLRIGAMARQAELLRDPLIAAHAPLIAQALAHVGHVQTRSRGTIGGSIVYGDPAAELPLVMCVLGAEFTIARAGAVRIAAAKDFFIGALVTNIEPDEILTEIAIPAASTGARCGFREYARRHGDFAIVAVAAHIDGASAAIGVGGLAAVPCRCSRLEAALVAGAIALEDAGALINADLADVEPLADLHASGPYRRRLADVLIRDIFADLGQRA